LHRRGACVHYGEDVGHDLVVARELALDFDILRMGFGELAADSIGLEQRFERKLGLLLPYKRSRDLVVACGNSALPLWIFRRARGEVIRKLPGILR